MLLLTTHLGVVVGGVIAVVVGIVDKLTCDFGAWILRDQSRVTSGGIDLYHSNSCFQLDFAQSGSYIYFAKIANELFSAAKIVTSS